MDDNRTTPRSPRAALEPERLATPKRRSRRARHPLVIIGNAIFTFVLLLAVVVGALAYWGNQRFEEPGPLAQDKVVNIPRGLGVRDIGELLTREGVIRDPWIFVAGAAVMKMRGADLKFGEYQFAKGASPRDVADTMNEGKVVQHQFTVAEGLTSEQIVARLLENDKLTGNVREMPREGSLLPDGYRFNRGTTRDDMIKRMQAAQARVLKEAWDRRVSDLPVTNSGTTARSCVDHREGNRQAGRADAGRGGVRQPAEEQDEAAIRPDHHLRAGRRQGLARPRHPQKRDHPADALQYLCDRRPSARADRQSGPRLDRGRRQSGAHARNCSSSPTAPAGTPSRKPTTSIRSMSRNCAASRRDARDAADAAASPAPQSPRQLQRAPAAVAAAPAARPPRPGCAPPHLRERQRRLHRTPAPGRQPRSPTAGATDSSAEAAVHSVVGARLSPNAARTQ